MRPCACGAGVADDEAFCPRCAKPVRSRGRRGRMPTWVRSLLGLVVLSLMGGYWVLILRSPTELGGATTSLAEQSAMQNTRAIYTAVVQYYMLHNPTFPRSLTDLQGLLSDQLLSGDIGGYAYELHATGAEFDVQAYPKVFGKTGTRSFYIDKGGILRESQTEQRANGSSPVAP